jgi:hypothetical protein
MGRGGGAYKGTVTRDHEMPEAKRLEHLDDAIEGRHLHDLDGALVHKRAADA